ncbi:MAG: oligosaccharide flippase family protein [bacterium]|nr:oligosaccharide flippase family protein [bacterium]
MVKHLLNAINKSFIKEVGVVTVGNGIGRAFAFLSTIFLARILSPEEFANFSIFFTITILCSQLFSGFDSAFVRFFAREEDPSSLRAFFVIKIVSIALLFTIGFGVLNLIASYLKIEDHRLFIPISFVGSAAIILLALPMSVFQTKEKFSVYSVLLSSPLVLFFFSIIIFWHFFNSTNFGTYFYLYVLSFLLVAILTIFFISRYLLETTHKSQTIIEIKKIFRFGKWLVLSTILYSFYQRADILILSHFADKDTVGIYAVAVRMVSLLSLITLSISIISNPKVSKVKSLSGLKTYLTKSFRTFLLLLPPLSIVILLRTPLIKLFFGDKYQQAGSIFMVLAIAYVLIMFYTPGLYSFYTLNKPYLVFIVTLVSAISLILFSYLFIPSLHYLGAAISVLGSAFTGAIITCVLVFRFWKTGDFSIDF